VAGHVYVNDNTKPVNTIGAFDRHADGTLTPEAGSPFAAGGAGTGSGLASQGALQFSADGRFLIAVDAGSNQISVLRVHSDGSLSLVPGGVVSSRGTLPDSIAVHGDLVYVANSGPGHSNYTGFRFFQGHLLRIPGSTVTLASDAAPGDVLFNGTGTVSAFKDHRNGRLSPIGASPFPDHQMAPCWVEITHDGQFLFTVNTASGTVSAYQIAASGALTLLPASAPAGGPTAGAVDARLSPDGGFLYVDRGKTGAVAAFAVNGGKLTQLGTSPFPLPAGAAPAGIVIS
jgi:6-phosphogluconolactonase (cycloisomerase 2 family)